eukprot:8139914-Lingulodinium_polyedra.AAC.1
MALLRSVRGRSRAAVVCCHCVRARRHLDVELPPADYPEHAQHCARGGRSGAWVLCAVGRPVMHDAWGPFHAGE